MGSKKNKNYKSKSKFRGNQFVGRIDSKEINKTSSSESDSHQADRGQKRPRQEEYQMTERQTENDSTSSIHTPPSQKRLLVEDCNSSLEEDYFLMINFAILAKVISDIGKCQECEAGSLEVINVKEARMGFVNKLVIICSKCKWQTSFYTSAEVAKKIEEGSASRGRKYYEANIRSVIAFREISKGHAGMENFARVMNINCLSSKAYKKMKDDICEAYETVAENSMKNAAKEVHDKYKEKLSSDETITLCDCSLDGTWQKRGHSSLNGVVTAIVDGKCIDKHVMSKFCKGCSSWENKKGTPAYENWALEHNCSANHSKSSGAMESSGAVAIYSSSVAKHNLIYKNYIGDGDTSSYKEVVNSKPYEKYDIVPKKLECVGHVQKRLGTRLRDLRKKYKNSKTPISGRGKLTDKVINSLQNYFGMAIRENKETVLQMKRAIGAVLFHCTDKDENTRHLYCPRRENS